MNLKSKKERREQIFAPQRLSNGRVLSLDAPQELTLLEFVQQGLSLTSTKAFSLAEAMIVLLIVTIALGMSAPMISKQLKNETMNNVQFQVLNKKYEELKKVKSDIPSGAVMYFDLDDCPAGWTILTKFYPQAAGSFLRNLGEEALAGEEPRKKGSYQGSALPDIKLLLRVDGSTQNSYSVRYDEEYGSNDIGGAMGVTTGGTDEPMYDMLSAVKNNRAGDLIKSDIYNKDVNEVRPNNIAFLACRKN